MRVGSAKRVALVDGAGQQEPRELPARGGGRREQGRAWRGRGRRGRAWLGNDARWGAWGGGGTGSDSRRELRSVGGEEPARGNTSS
jgi:hypothetical protein